jgi:thiol-disulfide isomerase/thioredoxin
MEQKKMEASTEAVIIGNSPASIKELMQIPGVKGKYAYVDLWATWCAPCTREFRYNDDIYGLFAQYSNIVPIYISIDTNEKHWESAVKRFNLKGYNILASKSLNEDIGMKVYRTKEIAIIPRYLLLDPAGNVVIDSLPGPSKSALLKPILDSVLK